LQSRHQIGLVLRSHFSIDLVDVKPLRNGLGGGRAISRSHDDANPRLMQRIDCTGCGILDWIVHSE